MRDPEAVKTVLYVMTVRDATEKPYTEKQFEDLNQKQQNAIKEAEFINAITVVVNKVHHDPKAQDFLHSKDIFLDDKALIDGPLARRKQLAEAYVPLSKDPEEAASKAQAFLTAANIAIEKIDKLRGSRNEGPSR